MTKCQHNSRLFDKSLCRPNFCRPNSFRRNGMVPFLLNEKKCSDFQSKKKKDFQQIFKCRKTKSKTNLTLISPPPLLSFPLPTLLPSVCLSVCLSLSAYCTLSLLLLSFSFSHLVLFDLALFYLSHSFFLSLCVYFFLFKYLSFSLRIFLSL